MINPFLERQFEFTDSDKVKQIMLKRVYEDEMFIVELNELTRLFIVAHGGYSQYLKKVNELENKYMEKLS